MTTPTDTSRALIYGTREWLDREYGRVGSDPWGLEWRPSQVARYYQMIDVLMAAQRPGAVAPRTVLDIGCATGTFTAMLAQALGGGVTEVRGIDVSELPIARARSRYPALTFDCLNMDEAGERFAGRCDLITMLEVLYYVPESERSSVLRLVRRMLKPGGMVLISSMIAQQPYMSALQLRELVGGTFTVMHSGSINLKPLTMIEKPLLRVMPFFERLRRGNARAVLPPRPRAARVFARIAGRVLGSHAVSHSYVVAVSDADGRV